MDILDKKIKLLKKNMYSNNEKAIKQLIKEELVSRYYFDSGRVEAMLQGDELVLEATKLLNDDEKYSQILKLK